MLIMPSKLRIFTTLILTSVILFADAQNSSLSALCTSQNEVLNANTALLAAAPTRECKIDQGKDSCTVNFESVSDNFKNACFDAGGIFYVVDLLWDCTTNIDGVSYNADFTYLNFPSCQGLNCTAGELEEAFETSVYALAEQDLLAQGFRCDVSDKNEMIIVKSGTDTLFTFSISGILGVFAMVMVVLHP